MKKLLVLSLLATFGFTSCESGEKTIAEQIAETEEGIRNNPDLLSQVKQKAEAAKIPLDQQIHGDAVWLYEEAHNLPHLGEAVTLSGKVPSKDEIIAMKEKDIRENPGMLESVKQKAEANKVPLDTMIRRDATWLYQEIMKLPHPGESAPAPAAPATDKPAAPAPAAH